MFWVGFFGGSSQPYKPKFPILSQVEHSTNHNRKKHEFSGLEMYLVLLNHID